MSVNSYLYGLAHSAVLRDYERESVQRSLNVLKVRLNQFFGDELSEHFTFGSYTRGTILPRGLDHNSDIDYMVVFKDSSFQPQTYLDKLRRFVNHYYSTSDIKQSNPTIILNLNHIRFELVPAIHPWWHGLRIPARTSDWNRWIDTDPNDFNKELTNANKGNNNLIKPTIRLAKYWNALNNYPYPSYELEKMLVRKSYLLAGGLLSTPVLKDYFFYAMKSLSADYGDSQAKHGALIKLHGSIRIIEGLIDEGLDASAEQELQKLLPATPLTKGLASVR